jgi:hypothetical protein
MNKKRTPRAHALCFVVFLSWGHVASADTYKDYVDLYRILTVELDAFQLNSCVGLNSFGPYRDTNYFLTASSRRSYAEMGPSSIDTIQLSFQNLDPVEGNLHVKGNLDLKRRTEYRYPAPGIKVKIDNWGSFVIDTYDKDFIGSMRWHLYYYVNDTYVGACFYRERWRGTLLGAPPPPKPKEAAFVAQSASGWATGFTKSSSSNTTPGSKSVGVGG